VTWTFDCRTAAGNHFHRQFITFSKSEKCCELMIIMKMKCDRGISGLKRDT
jgi:hypothetical protein